jgi:hypothetical protein
MNLPLASRHCFGFAFGAAAFVGHLMNLPCASLHGVAALSGLATNAMAASTRIDLI